MTLASPWIAALLALFVWWFSTGVILAAVRWADRHGTYARLALTLAALPLFGAGIWGFLASLDVQSVLTAYLGFFSAIALWGWIELAFLTGVIAGPVVREMPAQTQEWERFIRAWGTVAYHEMLLAATLATLFVASLGAANTIGLWTFAVLYFARVSAKLNLYLGVPKINVEFIPAALSHLPSHFRNARLNWLFPLSVTGLTMATIAWIAGLIAAVGLMSASNTVGYALLTAITALATLEHWFMVLPLPDEKLWRWMLPRKSTAPKTINTRLGSEDAHGL